MPAVLPQQQIVTRSMLDIGRQPQLRTLEILEIQKSWEILSDCFMIIITTTQCLTVSFSNSDQQVHFSQIYENHSKALLSVGPFNSRLQLEYRIPSHHFEDESLLNWTFGRVTSLFILKTQIHVDTMALQNMFTIAVDYIFNLTKLM